MAVCTTSEARGSLPFMRIMGIVIGVMFLAGCPAGSRDQPTPPQPDHSANDAGMLEAPPKTAKKMCVCECAGDFIPVADTQDIMNCRHYRGLACINRKGTKRGTTSDCGIALVYPGKPDVDNTPTTPEDPPAVLPASPDAGQPGASEQPGMQPR